MSTKLMILVATVALASAGALQAQQPADSASAAVYAKMCASCHGPKGTPAPAMARSMALSDFASAQTMAAVTDSALRAAVADGKGRAMPAYKTRLTAEQIDGLVRYIRTLGGH